MYGHVNCTTVCVLRRDVPSKRGELFFPRMNEASARVFVSLGDKLCCEYYTAMSRHQSQPLQTCNLASTYKHTRHHSPYSTCAHSSCLHQYLCALAHAAVKSHLRTDPPTPSTIPASFVHISHSHTHTPSLGLPHPRPNNQPVPRPSSQTPHTPFYASDSNPICYLSRRVSRATTSESQSVSVRCFPRAALRWPSLLKLQSDTPLVRPPPIKPHPVSSLPHPFYSQAFSLRAPP
jgi:hypothetical protein